MRPRFMRPGRKIRLIGRMTITNFGNADRIYCAVCVCVCMRKASIGVPTNRRLSSFDPSTRLSMFRTRSRTAPPLPTQFKNLNYSTLTLRTSWGTPQAKSSPKLKAPGVSACLYYVGRWGRWVGREGGREVHVWWSERGA